MSIRNIIAGLDVSPLLVQEASVSPIKFLLGRRLANREQGKRKITAFEGVPAMGLDGLGSSSYGPEAALAVLMPLGAAGAASLLMVMLPVLGLLAVLYFSYRQTICAYPHNGGAYTVSKANLGTHASLLAAAALMVDYVLNVAVGISAGVGALTSAVPLLHSHMLGLCLAILALITIMNLRGTADAGRAWALPAYLFVASFVLILAIGIFKTAAGGGAAHPIASPPATSDSAAAIGLWLFLRSFAAGCTAMTGVEAVSNGANAFREPVIIRAHRTLGAICAILAVLLGGIAYLAPHYGIRAMDQTQGDYQSVLSQLGAAVIGRGAFYDVAIGSALCVLCLSANTSFVAFPRICRLLAQDDFLPRPFAAVGRRLVYSVGILYLAAAAALLLIAFGGITDRLIPLFAIGAFLTFTLSQLSMVVHWRRAIARASSARQKRGHRVSFLINAVGAAGTGIALVIIILAKFAEGAWITLLVIPAVILMLKMIRRYYAELDAQLRKDQPLDLRHIEPPIVIVVTEGWNRLTDRALHFALRLSPDVLAVHLMALGGPDQKERNRQLRRKWSREVERPSKEAGHKPPKLVLLEANYRSLQGPLLRLIAETEKNDRDRPIAVLVPEVVKEHWWQHVLHGRRARRLCAALLRYGGSRVVVVNVPWYLEEPRIEEGLEQEDVPGLDARHARGG